MHDHSTRLRPDIQRIAALTDSLIDLEIHEHDLLTTMADTEADLRATHRLQQSVTRDLAAAVAAVGGERLP